MEIISDLSEICSGTVILCKANEVIMPANDRQYNTKWSSIEVQKSLQRNKQT